MMNASEIIEYKGIYAKIREILLTSRAKAYSAVNFAMVNCYWQIGFIIVEHEQKGALRAEYGKKMLQNLSEQLSQEFGKGFDIRNLRNMRSFYLKFPNRNALHTELTWTNYRLLIKIDSEQTRNWYMNEAIEAGWSSRQPNYRDNSLFTKK